MNASSFSRGGETLDSAEVARRHYERVVRRLGPSAVLELLDSVVDEKGKISAGAVAFPEDDDFHGIAIAADGRVSIQDGRHDSFNLPYEDALAIASAIVKEEA